MRYLLALIVLASVAAAQVPQPSPHVWIHPAQLARLPVSGPEWDAVKADADAFRSSPTIVFPDQDDKGDSKCMAAALVWARTRDDSYRLAVEAGLLSCIGQEDDDFPGENNSSLELARNLCALAIAADLIDWTNPADEGTFKAWIGPVRWFQRKDGRSIVSTSEERPNNWGTHAGAARAAIAVYLGDRPEIERCAKVFRGWLGDRSAYAGFDWGDLSWQVNPNAPVGINPRGARVGGLALDGILPDDQRRCGDFPADFNCETNYVWEAMQGVVTEAIILRGQGYDVWRWSDFAIGRAAYRYKLRGQGPDASVNSSDDRWQAWPLNRVYGLRLTEAWPAPHGKSVGFTPWACLTGNWPAR